MFDECLFSGVKRYDSAASDTRRKCRTIAHLRSAMNLTCLFIFRTFFICVGSSNHLARSESNRRPMPTDARPTHLLLKTNKENASATLAVSERFLKLPENFIILRKMSRTILVKFWKTSSSKFFYSII